MAFFIMYNSHELLKKLLMCMNFSFLSHQNAHLIIPLSKSILKLFYIITQILAWLQWGDRGKGFQS